MESILEKMATDFWWLWLSMLLIWVFTVIGIKIRLRQLKAKREKMSHYSTFSAEDFWYSILHVAPLVIIAVTFVFFIIILISYTDLAIPD